MAPTAFSHTKAALLLAAWSLNSAGPAAFADAALWQVPSIADNGHAAFGQPRAEPPFGPMEERSIYTAPFHSFLFDRPWDPDSVPPPPPDELPSPQWSRGYLRYLEAKRELEKRRRESDEAMRRSREEQERVNSLRAQPTKEDWIKIMMAHKAQEALEDIERRERNRLMDIELQKKYQAYVAARDRPLRIARIWLGIGASGGVLWFAYAFLRTKDKRRELASKLVGVARYLYRPAMVGLALLVVSGGIYWLNERRQQAKQEQALLSELADLAMTNRRPILEQLAIIGRDPTAEVFISHLTAHYNNRNLSQDEVVVLLRTLRCLGYVASRSRIARDFLRRRTHPEAWDPNRLWAWSAFEQPNHLQRYLAGAALGAMAAGGRPEFWAAIRRIQNSGMSPEVAERWGTMFIDAVHADDLRKRLSPQAVLALSGDSHFESYVEWRRRSTNHPIVLWYEKQKKALGP